MRNVESIVDADASVLAAALGDDPGKAAVVRRLAADVVNSRQAYDSLLGDLG